MNDILRLSDFEALAKSMLPTMAWEFLDSAAGDELTKQWNAAAYDRIQLLPNVLRDVSKLDISLNLLGDTLPHPILLAPIAYHKLFHPQGEIETAKGAKLADAVFCMSTMANTTIEEIAQAAPDTKLWYQLYVQRDRDYTKTLIERVQIAGAKALVVTVDTPVLGNRVRESRARFALPDGLDRAMLRDVAAAKNVKGHGTELTGIYYPLVDPALSWNDIEWMIQTSRVPVVLKGILNPTDAEIAVKIGAHAIIVSNHGARNLDTVPATIEMLPQIAERVEGKIPILLDGGIRRGTDVMKALVLGATAVLIGRPYVWGLTAFGAEGVAKGVELLTTELKIAMALCGRRNLGEVDRGIVRK